LIWQTVVASIASAALWNRLKRPGKAKHGGRIAFLASLAKDEQQLIAWALFFAKLEKPLATR
jgi:hypothetical protein